MSEYQQSFSTSSSEEAYLLSKKSTRRELCKRSFYHFVVYYLISSLRYPQLAPFHFERFKAVSKYNKIYCEGMRECAKTTILGLANELWQICYQKSDFICNLCFNKNKATSFNKMLVAELSMNKKIVSDFGVLFSKRKVVYDEEMLPETGISEFTTTTGIKVKAFGMGEVIRGLLHRHPTKGLRRPDFLLVDDIDNIFNTKNTALIDKDMLFIQNEAFGSLANYAKIVVLGNIIRMDGRNVRIRETYKTNPQRKVFSSFLYGPAGTKEGTIQRSRYVATDEEARRLNEGIPLDEGVISIEHLKSEQMSGFLQNYLGIPDLGSQKYVQAEDILPMKIPSKKVPRNELDYIAIGIDPAFSTKTASDAIGIVVMGFHTIKTEDEKTRRKKYTLKGVALEGEEKRQTNFVAVVKAMYQNYHVSRITIEGNNGGSILAEQLKAEGLAVDVVNASKDKVTRFKEQERDLQNGNIYFVEGETEGLIAELLDFTGEDGKQDNLADAFVYSLYDKKFTFWVSGENDPEPEPEIEEDDR